MRVLGQVSTCMYIDGVHWMAGPDCPHDRNEDEVGEIAPQGWTCQ